jgi:hypothetical protein
MREPVREPLPLPWPRARLISAWVLALCGGAVALGYAWAFSAADPRRNDGNSGHASIDFGGQWLMGRMIVEGEGRRLYHRPTIRAVLERNYPRADENPADASDKSDADKLMDWLSAGDGTIAPETVGGALYPPVNALLCAPLGCLPPRVAYRIMQTLNLLLVFALGWLAQRWSEGRVWWPVASLLLMLFPGYAGAINLGQNSVVSLLFLTVGWFLAVRGYPLAGGALWGLLAFKPVWAVAFFPVTLLTQRWRMALGMVLSGLTLVALTLPLVGWQSWLDWLAVGQLAAKGYARDDTWIVLSRDVQGAVRRFFMAAPNAAFPSRLAVGCWLTLWAAAVILPLFRPRALRADDGPGPAFVLLGAWLGCFHFMYYDSFLAALPMLLLFTPRAGRKVVPFIVLVLLIGSHYAATTIDRDRTFRFPPFDTYLAFALWAWCGYQVLRPGRVRSFVPGKKFAPSAAVRQVG